ncbi:hypothetical protein VTN77DRAFT_3203 [Rasamsonia byssochlamydoides]|uniref:uncharacterized protein n=1 Tax=Rasamsonia byssochlamydoides TaxID=89139 RepID=UPI0037429057
MKGHDSSPKDQCHTSDRTCKHQIREQKSSSVNQHPDIQELICRRDDLGRRLGRPLARHKGTVKYDLYQKLNCELARARQRAQDALLVELQDKYDKEQPMLEVQRQLSGVKLSETVNHSLEQSEEVPLPQRRLIEALLTLPRPTLEEEMLRRTKAIDAITAYCLLDEGDTCRIAHEKRRRDSGPIDAEETEDSPKPKRESGSKPTLSQRELKLQAAVLSVSEEKRPLYCLICVGKSNLDLEKRTQTFKTHGDVTKHIKRKHLRYIADGDPVGCELCRLSLLHKMDFQRHAIDAHSTVT